MELASHNALIQDKRFQEEEIPKQAENLSKRLSLALAPIFIEPSNACNVKPESWGQTAHVYEERHLHFKELFAAALRAKAYTVLTDQNYNFTVHPPGKLEHSNETDEPASRHAHPPGEQSWLLARLCSYPSTWTLYPRCDGLDGLDDSLIQYKNFARKTPEDKVESILYAVDLRVTRYKPTRSRSRALDRSAEALSSIYDEQEPEADVDIEAQVEAEVEATPHRPKKKAKLSSLQPSRSLPGRKNVPSHAKHAEGLLGSLQTGTDMRKQVSKYGSPTCKRGS